MKKLISLCLALVLACSCFSLVGNAFWGGAMPAFEPGTYDATKLTTKYVAVKNVYKGTDGTSTTSTNSYDKNGNLTKSVYKSGEYTATTTYTYDADGNITKRAFENTGDYSEIETFTYSSGKLKKQTYEMNEGEGVSKGTTTYSYNKKGLLTKSAYATSDDSFTYTYSYSYNDAGYVSKIVYKSPGATSKTTTYTYDKKNRLTKSVTVSDEESTTTKYSYDSKGNITKIVCESSNDYSAYTTTRTYDKNGNVLTDKTVTGTGEPYVTKSTYDSKGRKTKEVYSSSDGYEYTWTIKYDSNGNVVKETNTTADGTAVSTYTYKKLSKEFVTNGMVKLAYASTTYNGKEKKPAVQVSGASNGADYRLVYSNNKKPGTATVKIIFNNPEMGVITFNYVINPAKPTGLKVSAKTKTTLTLAWTKTTGAAKYVVYRIKADGSLKKMATVTTNKATIKNLTKGTTYKFCVMAVTSGGLKSAYSAKLSAKTAS